jgi:ferredoxin--NADP+ reductase
VTAGADAQRVAVVGAGPAGFYATDRLLKSVDHRFEVDLFDRLPTPWGLVRAGVAPDHPNIKVVSRVFEKTAALPGFRYRGNVEVGRDIQHAELAAHYHAVTYTTGASVDRRLGIPGEDLPGSEAATDFVAWYNGHPDAAAAQFDLRTRRAVVIGNGNVALDVARMLVLTRDELAGTDVADHALDALTGHDIEEVVVLGRRGPAQAAYTTPELRELGVLTDADVVVDPAEAELDPASLSWLESDAADGTARRNVEVVQDYAGRSPKGLRRRVVLRYLASPLEIVGGERVQGLRVGRNRLVAGPDGGLRAEPTGEEELIEAGLVLRSVGYLGRPLPGLPFDERAGTLCNTDGRVTDEDGAVLPGVYTAGWVKRGPSGVIGTNKKCANATVTAVLDDAEAGALPTPAGSRAAFDELLAGRCPDAIDYAGWELIDRWELAAGEDQGRPRVKIVERAELLQRATMG